MLTSSELLQAYKDADGRGEPKDRCGVCSGPKHARATVCWGCWLRFCGGDHKELSKNSPDTPGAPVFHEWGDPPATAEGVKPGQAWHYKFDKDTVWLVAEVRETELGPEAVLHRSYPYANPPAERDVYARAMVEDPDWSFMRHAYDEATAAALAKAPPLEAKGASVKVDLGLSQAVPAVGSKWELKDPDKRGNGLAASGYPVTVTAIEGSLVRYDYVDGTRNCLKNREVFLTWLKPVEETAMGAGSASGWAVGQLRRGAIEDVSSQEVVFRVLRTYETASYDWRIEITNKLESDERVGRQYGFKEEWPSVLVEDEKQPAQAASALADYVANSGAWEVVLPIDGSKLQVGSLWRWREDSERRKPGEVVEVVSVDHSRIRGVVVRSAGGKTTQHGTVLSVVADMLEQRVGATPPAPSPADAELREGDLLQGGSGTVYMLQEKAADGSRWKTRCFCKSCMEKPSAQTVIIYGHTKRVEEKPPAADQLRLGKVPGVHAEDHLLLFTSDSRAFCLCFYEGGDDMDEDCARYFAEATGDWSVSSPSSRYVRDITEAEKEKLRELARNVLAEKEAAEEGAEEEAAEESESEEEEEEEEERVLSWRVGDIMLGSIEEERPNAKLKFKVLREDPDGDYDWEVEILEVVEDPDGCYEDQEATTWYADEADCNVVFVGASAVEDVA